MSTARFAASFLFALAQSATLAAAQTLSLNDTLPESLAGGSPRDFAVSADGTRVVFSGDFETVGLVELWNAPADHSAPPVKLSGGLLSGGGVASFLLVGTRVVYRAVFDGRTELFSVPIDGSAGPTRLDPLRRVVEFAPTPDGARIVYRNLRELFSVPIDGSAAPVELMDSPDSCVAFYVAPAGGRVVARWQGAVDEYRSQLAIGTGPVAVVDTTIYTSEPAELVRFSDDGAHFFHDGKEFIPYSGYAHHLRSACTDGSTTAVELGWGEENLWFVLPGSSDVILATPGGLTRIHANGGAPVTLAALGGGFINWVALTPDAGTVLFSHESPENRFLAHVPVDGSQPYANTPGTWSNAFPPTSRPIFNASGSHALFNDRHGIYSLSTSWTSPAVTLAPASQEEPLLLRLLPNDEEVVFAADVVRDCSTGWQRKELYRCPIDGSGPLVRLDRSTGEGVTSFVLADGGSRVAYLDANNPANPTPLALYGVPVNGSGRARLYHDSLGVPPTLGDVTDSWISPDGSVAVYRADQEYDGTFGLYAVSLSEPGEPVRLCEQNATTIVLLSTDGSRVAFEVQRGSVESLYCARTDGSEPAVLIAYHAGSVPPFSFKPVLSSNGEFVAHCLFTGQIAIARADGSSPTVKSGPTDLYVSAIGLDESTQWIFFTGTVSGNPRMYAMPVDASQPAIRIVPAGGTPPPLTGAVAVDGSVYYLRTTAGVNELYAVPIDGSALPARLSAPLVAGGSVASYLVQDGVVLYRADGTVDERIDLYRSTGPSTSVTLASMPGTSDVQPDLALSPDGARAFYRADPALPGRIELFSVASDGSGAPVTLATPTGVFDVSSFAVSADGNRVAFGQEDGDAPLVDLWTVPAGGGTPTQVESRVRAFAFTPELELVCSVEPASGPFEVVAHKLGGRRKLLATLSDTVPVTAFTPLPDERVVWRGDAREAGVTELFLSLTGFHGRSPLPPNGPPGDGGTIVR